MTTPTRSTVPAERTILRRTTGAGLATLVAGVALTLGACTPLATYPPVEGTRTVEPWVHPVPEIMGVSLRHTRAIMNPTHPPVVNLPAGVTASTWETVMSFLGPDARVMTEDDATVFAVTQVRLSGARAECDVVYPTPDGLAQMVTIGLRTEPFQNWRVDFVRKWRIPAEFPTPTWEPRQLRSLP